ncbi:MULTISPECIES: RidA family protein [unclassified Candidatus Frackibacter]|uniref:RidA family protein n=1 Tax=unclassified Candidatus Frackibacter TaxID=2648818 RepID=UPI0008879403|nr:MULTISPECIES: RidA family protein [unclassified Candidatus Frackibacter]SDC83031.1 endoribonuclease L-PSP [Candidatus Frackibacter sp. WG11]SEM97507.1 endoribonuclease L-PSP [Candidatus Frackibacter sp. WG12]SFM06287.1 endoribonuclease L-PSP [Candidatus Frackibacter sp. WG13]
MEKTEIKTDKSPAAIGPYSQAIQLDNLVLTSGQIPFTPEGELVSNDVKEQARQSLENVKGVLEAAGTDLDKVVKCTVFISNMDDFPKINEVYQEFFKEPYPARSCVEVSRLPKDVKLEIEAIAYKK